MAITRCPYCHAIIDENDKYCNNCGTQLLFSEDEEIEEEIPGEKIVDAEVEEKDYTVEEPEDEKRPAPAKDLDSEIDEELAQELREETEEMALDELVAEEARKAGEDDVTEEVILVDEIEAAEAAGQDDSKALVEEGPAGSKKPEPDADDDEEDEEDEEKKEEKEGEREEEEDEDEEEEEELADELEDKKEGEAVKEETETEEETREYAAAALKRAAEAAQVPEAPVPPEDEPVVEYVSEIAAPDEAATAGEAAFRPATFDTKEFENLGRTVELSKEKVEKLLEVLSEKRTAAPPSPAPPPPPLPALEPTPAAAPIPQTGSLPPWASTMKGAPVFAEDTGSVETRKFRGGEPATEEEVEIFPRRRAADSTIGLPEKVSQSPLPFGAPAPEEEAEDEEAGDEAAEETKVRDLTPEKVVLPAGQVRSVRELGRAAAPGGEIETPEEREEPGPRPPFSFSVFFKSKAFDVLFVGLFWLVALWLAASSLGVTLFAILGSMSGPMLLLYAVFILIYFFLFKFFLGETLGDRLFRPRE